MTVGAQALKTLSKSPALGYALLGAVAIVGFVVVKNALAAGVSQVASAAGTAGTAVLDTASGIATGNLASAQGTPYQGFGILGTLGLATDKLFGGGLSAFGGWIGSKVYDITNSSPTNQGANNNPYGGGPSSSYADAVNSAPVNATSAATPTTDTPIDDSTLDFGLIDPNS